MRNAKKAIGNGVLKKRLVFCLAAAFALGVAACGGDSGKGGKAQPDSDPAQTVGNQAEKSQVKKSTETATETKQTETKQTETKKENSTVKDTAKESESQ